jgi:hypothetical protein
MSTVKEADVESYLVSRVQAAGGVAEKVTVIGTRGFYDRLVVLPGGRVVFVECKKPKGGRVSRHQKIRHATYRALGAEVMLLKTLADVDHLVDRDAGGGVDRASVSASP